MRLYYFTSAKYGLAALRDSRVKLSTFNNLNDPFELFSTDHADPTIRHSYRLLKEKLASQMGLLCCSKSWHSTLQWSHYADRHRGVALELEVDDKCVTHVDYRTERIPMTREVMNAALKADATLEFTRGALKVKSAEWSYEDEARIFYDISNVRPQDGLYFAPLAGNIRLSRLILGPLCTTSLDEISAVVPSGELPVCKARIAFRSFRVVPDLSFGKRR